LLLDPAYVEIIEGSTNYFYEDLLNRIHFFDGLIWPIKFCLFFTLEGAILNASFHCAKFKSEDTLIGRIDRDFPFSYKIENEEQILDVRVII
jgi:hypothetical protein